MLAETFGVSPGGGRSRGGYCAGPGAACEAISCHAIPAPVRDSVEAIASSL